MPLLVALSGWRGTPGPARGVAVSRGVQLGLITGILHFAGTVYWTGQTVHTFGGLALPIAAVVAFLLVLYMALYVGLTGGIVALLARRLGTRGLLLAPAVWVTAEYARGHLFGGFPWIPIGSATVTLLPVAQLASVVGVYGVSLFVAGVNACLALAIVSGGRVRLGAAAAAALSLGLVSAWGGARLSASTLLREGTPVRVGVVQGNIPQSEKWDPFKADEILARYLTLTREVGAHRPELVIWPESSTPFTFEDDEDPAGTRAVRQAAADAGAALLFGSDEVAKSERRYFNSAYMLDTAGATAAVYRKIQLVPFGEYVPFQEALFFVAPLVEAVSSFSRGTQVTMLPVNGHMASTAICYEVVYPHLIRRGVLEGAELLTTITNDAWYGATSAPYQHFELASMRAIEQGRYLARAANTGISGFVDPYGRVLARTELYQTTTAVAELRFLQGRTVYARIGDLAAQLAVFATLLAIGAAVWTKRRGH